MNLSGRVSIAAACAALALLASAPAAQATIAGIPEQDGDINGATGDITCTTQGAGPNVGERHCSGQFITFDLTTPIDINVGFPPAPGSGPDGDFPVVGVFHGWGGSKLTLQPADDGMTPVDERDTGVMQGWLNSGYAVFSMSDRGWGQSCGAPDPERLLPQCAEGYNHLMDTRFEVRDAQELFEALADRLATGATAANEGLIDPQRIGVHGGSYGGGISMALAALKNRELHGEQTLVPWVSEDGKQMQIAAAQPDIPWTDLAYSLAPNGYTLDYVKDAPYARHPSSGDSHIGVLKKSWVDLLYSTGQGLSNYAGPGTGPMGGVDPDADLNAWYTRVNTGEPYDGDAIAEDMVDELTKHHSSYYIDDTTAPAPLLISNGWTDDLFPADEAIRFYNRTRSQHPGTPISLIFTDHGHARGANKPEDAEFRNQELHEWFDHYVKGGGPAPSQGVQTLTQSCPSDDMTPSAGAGGAPFDDADADSPYSASSWATMAPGEVRLADGQDITILPAGGSPAAEAAWDPQSAMDDPCTTANATDAPGTASYRTDPVPAGGVTLMGSPTVIADLNSTGAHNQVAARLIDVDPMSGNGILVARALYRPDVNTGATPTAQVFQLHPNGYRFVAGHEIKLELLSRDSPYARPSNGQTNVTVTDVELRLPVLEAPGALGGFVTTPGEKVLPPGYQLAADFLPLSGGDFDGDGIPNSTDVCPTVNGMGSANGCPGAPGDSDRDGIPNSRDLCPTVIGIADNNGCPLTESGSPKGKKCKKRKAKKKSAASAKKKKCKRRKRR